MKKIFFIISCFIISAQAFADDGAVYDKNIEKFFTQKGMGRVYINGKATTDSDVPCQITRQEQDTEYTERDVLVIGYTGTPEKAGLFGAGFGSNGGPTFWLGGVIYDSATKEKNIKVNNLSGWEICYNDNPATAFAESWIVGQKGTCSFALYSSNYVELSEGSVSPTGVLKETRKTTCSFK